MNFSRLVSALSKSCASKVRPDVRFCSNSPETDFLHRSKVPTDVFQKSLPRLSIPSLDKSCERYLNSLKPVISEEQLANTKRIVADFQSSDGKRLHEELVAFNKQNTDTSYITGFWFDMYLRYRESLMLNHNPYMVFNDDPNNDYNDQLIRSTNMVLSSLRFMKTLRANILEPEVFHLDPTKSDTKTYRAFVRLLPSSIATYGSYLFKAFPLDMSQYGRLFNSTRIPRKEKDELFTDTSARHIVVLRNGHFFKFDVLDANGNIKPAEEILNCLKYIQADQTPAASHPISVLSSESRDTWANVRDDLLEAGNGELINEIDSGAFVLAMDSHDVDDQIALCKSFLHGDGSNRWFDKSFTLIVTKNGRASVNFEHAWGDGVAVLRYFNEVYKDTLTRPRVNPETKPASIDASQSVKRLDFVLNDKIKQAISDAQTKFNLSVRPLDGAFMKYEKFGKDYVKDKKISPDALMQLAFQLAFYRQYGQTVPTYESCSTAAFKHGRTETVRPATVKTKSMVAMIEKTTNRSTPAEMLEAIRDCSKYHFQLNKEAAMGQGFDRHLFAMRCLAEKTGYLPQFYQDPSYKYLNSIILSTSTLTSPAVLIGGFAPVTSTGYGIGYAVEKNWYGCNITCFSPERNVHEFVECLKSSLNDLQQILEGTDPKSC